MIADPMSLFQLTIAIAWIGVFLAACRVHPGLGFWAALIAIGSTLRAQGAVAAAARSGEPPSQARQAVLAATSAVVATLITGSGLAAFLVPMIGIGLILDLLDTTTGFTAANPREVLPTIISLVVTLLILAMMVVALIVAGATMVVVARQLGPVAPTWLRGGPLVLRLGGAGLLIAMVGFGLHSEVEAIKLSQRIARIEGWARRARGDQAAQLRCIEYIERGSGRCPRCATASAATLTAEADHAGKVAVAGEERIRELRAEWRVSFESWLCPPWAAVLAGLALIVLTFRALRRADLLPARFAGRADDATASLLAPGRR